MIWVPSSFQVADQCCLEFVGSLQIRCVTYLGQD